MLFLHVHVKHPPPPQQKNKITKEQTDSQNLVIPQVPSIMHIVFINGPLLDKIHVATL